MYVGHYVLIAALGLLGPGAEAQYRNQRFRDNSSSTITVASIISPPFLREIQDADDQRLVGNARYEGFIKDLMDEISRISGFKYIIRLPDDGKYGHYDNGTGQWSGMVGLLLSNEADVIAADLTVTYDRLSVLDFSRPFLTAPLTVLTRRSQSDSTSASGILGAIDLFAPYHLEVWLIFLAAFIVTGLVLWLVLRLSPYEQWPFVYPRPVNLTDAVWFVFAGIFRGSSFTPRSLSARFLTAGWWIFTLAFVFVYVFSLDNFLNKGHGNVRTTPNLVEEMLSDSDFRFAVLDGGATITMLKRSPSPLHQQIYARITEYPEQSLLSSLQEGVEMLLQSEDVRGDKLGLIMEGSAASYVAANNCDLKVVGNLAERQFSFGFARGNPLRTVFSRALVTLVDNGFIHLLRDKWWDLDRKQCAVQDDAKVTQPLPVSASSWDIENMMWPFIFLAIMLVVGLLLALIELIYYVWTSKSALRAGETKAKCLTRRLKEACVCKKAVELPAELPASKATQTIEY